MPIKILLLEDSEAWLDLYRRYLDLADVEVTIFSSPSIAGAKEIIAANPDMRIVVVDGNVVDGKIDDTCAFVRELRTEGFAGHMIAASADISWRLSLVDAGCNRNYEGEGKLGMRIVFQQVLKLVDK